MGRVRVLGRTLVHPPLPAGQYRAELIEVQEIHLPADVLARFDERRERILSDLAAYRVPVIVDVGVLRPDTASRRLERRRHHAMPAAERVIPSPPVRGCGLSDSLADEEGRRALCGPSGREPMNLRQIICALRGHRFHCVGVVLGQRLERCERCDKTRSR
jgi:hypothetical protein